MTTSAADEPRVTLYAPAKVNLRLVVLAREESGFHQLETVFCALELGDVVEVRPGSHSLRLHVHGSELGRAEDNLAYKAAQCFFRAAGIPAAAEITLHKHIPVGGGLGGGSSDAAATLRALDALCGHPLGDPGLLDLAPQLGSDVAFFLAHAPLALAWGRGERMLSLPPLPAAPVLLAVPPFPSPTPDAYRQLAEDRGRGHTPRAARLTLDRLADWPTVAEIAWNDFERSVFRCFPELAGIKTSLADCGAAIALLAGSGSTVFGVFHGTAERDAAAEALRERFPDVKIIRTQTATACSGQVRTP